MNRELKFRVIEKHTNQWMYGGKPFHQCSFGIIKETIGQFTGRADDGGDELYEGDIISFDYELNGYEGVIQWSEDFSAFVVKRKDEELLFLYDVDDAVTKIGNVYNTD